MKRMKNALRWADRLRVGCAAAMVLCAMKGKMDPGPIPLLLTVISLLVFLSVEFLMNRCAHCDRYLGRNWGRFCQHCGERIREERTQT